MHIKLITQKSIAMLSLKHYTLEGLEPRSSLPEADAKYVNFAHAARAENEISIVHAYNVLQQTLQNVQRTVVIRQNVVGKGKIHCFSHVCKHALI
jgi:hypothetical protein